VSADDGDASHLDIVRAIGRLEGRTEENFTTLFNVQRQQDSKLDAMNLRLARLEVRPRGRPAAHKPMTWKGGIAIAAAVVAILGGLSAAYHEAATVLTALHKALDGSK
jgi:hypothetical protein